MSGYFWSIDALALATSCIAFFFTVRLKSTYFLGSRFFIALANLAYSIVLLQATLDNLAQSQTNETLYLSMISVMLLSVGFASYLLQIQNKFAGIREIRDFFHQPTRQFIIYLSTVIGWTATMLVMHPYQLQVANTTEGIISYIRPEPLFVLASLVVLLAFLFLPVLTFYKQSSVTRDSKAAGSIRIISFAWASFGLVAFLQSVVDPSVYPVSQSLLQMANGALFLVIAYALREPTALGRMIAGSSLQRDGLYFGNSGVTIILYNMDSDRKRFVQEFLRTEAGNTSEVFCYVPKSDVPYYHAIIRETSPQNAQQKRERVTIRPIEASGLNTTSNPELSPTRRELIDTGDLEISLCRKFAEDRKRLDQSGRVPRDRIWAISAENVRTVLFDEISHMNPGARIIDLAANQNSFSQRLGIVHKSLVGNRILLEFDPVSNYETIVHEFVNEFVSNVQPVAVFTSLGSPVFQELQQARNVRLFVFSSKISTPFRASDAQVLLPDRDSSLLLDAVDKLVQANRGKSVALVFEVFTDIVLSQGFEKSYGVLSSIMEMAESSVCTGLVLLNPTCLDEFALQGMRGLFKLNYRYGVDGLANIRSNMPSVSTGSNRIPAFVDQSTSLRSTTVS